MASCAIAGRRRFLCCPVRGGPAYRHGPIMPPVPGPRPSIPSRANGCDLAQRRLDYYTELYRSGRWRHYYTEETLALRMLDVIKAVKLWAELAPGRPGDDDQDRSAPCRMKIGPSVLGYRSGGRAGLMAPPQPGRGASDLKRGEALLTQNCGCCHAVGRSGNSTGQGSACVPHAGPALSDRIAGRGAGRGHHVRPP